jgi:hypothetical protein
MSDLKMTNAADYMGTFNSDSLNEYTIQSLPSPVGTWVIGGLLHINITKRPTDEQIKNTEEMFGWEWKEYNV